MTVEPLHKLERGRALRSTPRQRLAELRGRADSLTARIAELQTPTAARQAAVATLPAAMTAHAAAAQEADLARGTRTQATADNTLERARAEVQRLRRAIAETADHSGEIAQLRAEVARIGDAIRAETAAVILAEVDRLTGEYHRHSKAALVAEAALQGLRAWAVQAAEHPVHTQIDGAMRLHPDLAESALRFEVTGGVLADVRRVWTAFPVALAADHTAEPEPLGVAVAALPVRREEIAEGEPNVAA